MIGASGAVAGVMGAFMIRFWSIKIRMLYWFAFLFYGTFFEIGRASSRVSVWGSGGGGGW